MKTLQKLLVIVIVVACMVAIMPQNISLGSTADVVGSVEATIDDGDWSSSLSTTIGSLLGFLQVASGLIAILMIALTGFNYIIATPQVKEELQKKMLPIIVGLVLVFGAVSIAKFILGAVGGG